jgi:hypothetical protein
VFVAELFKIRIDGMALQCVSLVRLLVLSVACISVRTAGTYKITTYAGTGVSGYSGDGGAATSAMLYAPKGVAVTNTYGVLIADVSNHRIRLVYPNGTIVTFAGTGVAGSSGDNGRATRAQLNEPTGISYVATGVLQGVTLVSDMSNQKVRKITAAGIITTIAGNGTVGFSPDGTLATSCMLNFPQAAAADATGIVYIADFYNNVIRKIAADSKIYTIAGVGTYGYGGDGGPVCNIYAHTCTSTYLLLIIWMCRRCWQSLRCPGTLLWMRLTTFSSQTVTTPPFERSPMAISPRWLVSL